MFETWYGICRRLYTDFEWNRLLDFDMKLRVYATSRDLLIQNEKMDSLNPGLFSTNPASMIASD